MLFIPEHHQDIKVALPMLTSLQFYLFNIVEWLKRAPRAAVLCEPTGFDSRIGLHECKATPRRKPK